MPDLSLRLAETAFAKVNLALHVRARRDDGYHELESLFVFCADGDRLTGQASDDGTLTLTVTGPFAADLGAGEDNLVLRAAHALRTAAGVGAGAGAGASLSLEKNLPIASGIGGGSADAAAALRLLMRLWDVPPSVDLLALAAGLGADVPACIGSQTVFGTGVGERLNPVDLDLAGTPILLVNPLLPCPTGPVFRAWDGRDRGPLNPRQWIEGRNDLQAPALSLVPEIAVLEERLLALPGTSLVRMSGSGATFFALFADEGARDAAAAAFRADRPDCWTMASMLR